MKYNFIGEISVPWKQAFPLWYIRPDIEHGPWIAGGAVRHWMEGKEVPSDIDVYFLSEKQMQRVCHILVENGFDTRHETANAVTLSHHGDQPTVLGDQTPNNFEIDVQLIKKEYFSNPREILNAFDFAQCQLVTDGVQVYGNPLWESMELQIDNWKPDTVLKRALKYYAYGYDIKPGTFTEWSEHSSLNYNFMNQESY